MCASMIKWRECLKKHFGAPSSRKWYRLYADVVCVLLGLKPALLVDYIPTDGTKFCFFLQDVLRNESILTVDHSAKLCVFQLGDDTVLSNVEYLGLTPECSGGMSVQYVDITKDMRYPCVLPREAAKARKLEEEYLKWCGTVKERLNKQETVDGSRDELHIPMVSGESSGIGCQNLCTLFGRLLGYPVVYWFEPEKSYSLDMVDLVCHAVTICSVGDPAAKYSLNQEHTLYSFTVPECVLASVKGTIDLWLEQLRARATAAGCSIEMNSKTVCLPTVAL